jgi:hypothetical protein
VSDCTRSAVLELLSLLTAAPSYSAVAEGPDRPVMKGSLPISYLSLNRKADLFHVDRAFPAHR